MADRPANWQSPATDPSPPPQAQGWRERLVWPLSLLSGLLLWLAYFPADWGWLAWFALVPWLWLLRIGRGRVLLSSFAGGMLFGLLAVQWVRLAHPTMYFAWFGLALLLALHWWLFAVGVRWLVTRQGWPLPLAAPLVWTVCEFVRARLDIGFSWYFLAHTQHHLLPYLGLVPVTGAYGISALVMLVNAVIAEFLVRWHRRGQCCPASMTATVALSNRALFWWSLLAVGLLLVNPLLARHWQKGFPPFGVARIVIVQPNEPQEIRNEPSEERWQKFLDSFKELVMQVHAHLRHDPQVKLVVWPETSMPYTWVRVEKVTADPASTNTPVARPWDLFTPEKFEKVREEERETLATIRELARLLPVPQVHGVNTRLYFVDDTGTPSQPGAIRYRLVRYNSALLVDSQGNVLGRYDKMYCIPFGEYVPLRDIFPWMEWLSPYSDEYSILPGTQAKPLAVVTKGGIRFAVLICYEDTVPHLPRQFFAQTTPDFFVNLSNDGWFHGSEEHEQHLAIARFRAAETRRALVRSVNMGISAVIDGDGSILALPKENWRASKACAAVFVADVPQYAGLTIYVRWGDWFCWSCVAGLSLSLLVSAGRHFILHRRSSGDSTRSA